jgi:hypothetical protein
MVYTLGNHLENLTLGGSAATGTGNELDNVLIGNGSANTLTGHAGNDTLDGGSGNDTMIGGAGDDTYIVAQGSDVTTEDSGNGVDTVQASVTHILSANIERLLLTSTSSINGTGNELANYIAGNAQANTLTGLLGDDALVGGNGADVYNYSAGHGADTIDNYSTDTAQDRLQIANLTRSEFTFSRDGNDLLVSRNGSMTDSIRVNSWFVAIDRQIDSVQFSDQALTAAQINALVPQGLMAAPATMSASKVASTQDIDALFAAIDPGSSTNAIDHLLMNAHDEDVRDWETRVSSANAANGAPPSEGWLAVRNHLWRQPIGELAAVGSDGMAQVSVSLLATSETPQLRSPVLGRMETGMRTGEHALGDTR